MFTGLIEEIGVVSRRSGPALAILAKAVLNDLKPGDSIAVDGVCLTATRVAATGFDAQVSPETLSRTTLGQIKPGDAVNLERPLAAGGRFGGHFVLGHVDGVGRIASIHDQGTFALWRFQASDEVARYLAPKGSIAVDGISLTIVEPVRDTFGVAVIPETLRRTTLGNKRPGDAVNLEADVLGKHVYHFLKGMAGAGRPAITREFLSDHGFM